MAAHRFDNLLGFIVTITASLTSLYCTPLPTLNLCAFNDSNCVRDGGEEVISTEVNCSVDFYIEDDGPLLLTPYVQNGCLEEARRLSWVRGIPGMTLDSFSGFLTVGESNEANLFFWFFPSKINSRTAPVLLWLNGGPGTSSLSGLFAENGPYYVTEEQTLRYRENNWATEFNVIYLDNPIGAGFSFGQSNDDYRNSSVAVAQDIYEVLVMFFKIFSYYSTNEFFVIGQSYGGRFAVLLADIIDSKNSVADSSQRLNFKGIICVAGFLHPPTQLKYADYWFQVGLLNPTDYSEALSIEKEIQQNLGNGNFIKARTLIQSYFLVNDSFVFKSAGFKDGESILQSTLPDTFKTYINFLKHTNVRLAIHVANLTFAPYSREVARALYDDIFTDVISVLEQILNKGYKVLLMSGNLDIYVVPTAYWKMIWDLEWQHTEAFRQSERRVWKVHVDDKDFAGYVNCAKNLCYSLVRNGGHRLTSDQTRSTADLVRRFIYGLLPNNFTSFNTSLAE